MLGDGDTPAMEKNPPEPGTRHGEQPPRRSLCAQGDNARPCQADHPPEPRLGAGARRARVGSTFPVAPLNAAQRDWHAELLCGLFLRSDEKELEWLEQEVQIRNDKGESSPVGPSVEQSPNKNGGLLSGNGGHHSETERSREEEGIVGGETPSRQQNNIHGTDDDGTDNFLMEMLHLGQAMNSTVLSLIPEALRTVTSEIPQLLQQDLDLAPKGGETNPGEESKTYVDGVADSNTDGDVISPHPPRGSTTLTGDSSIAADVHNNGIDRSLCETRAQVENTKKNDNNSQNAAKGGREQLAKLDDASDINKPLLIPATWKRPDYTRRSLPELEQHVMESPPREARRRRGSGREARRRSGSGQSTKIKNGMNGSHPPREPPKTYDLFALLYNECSLTAMANWAMLDHSTNGSANNESGSNEEWEKYKKAREKRQAMDKRSHEVIIPPSKFHMCSVCGRFGHYEAECELLLDDHQQNSVRETRDGNKKNAHHRKRQREDDVGFSLGDKERNAVISSLSREIHAQRRQRQLYKNHRLKHEGDGKKGEGGDKTKGGAASASLQVEGDSLGNGVPTEDDEKYSGKSSCCRICRSGIDDQEMLVCDGCDDLFHCKCLDPPLDCIPEGDWFCSNCKSYDSDVSSVVDIEGFGDYVFEQRKRSVAEEAKVDSGVSLGQSKSSWTKALTILPEEDPIVEDEIYLQKHLGREHGRVDRDFFVGELCWAKPSSFQSSDFQWWPAMVTDSETRTLRDGSSRKTVFSVDFFGLDEDAEIRDSDILPFLPCYEDFGHNLLMKKWASSNHIAFRNAMMLGVSALGLKSLGQTLILARDGIQISAGISHEYQKALSPGWKIPVGWESAEVDIIDDMVILAKEGGNVDHVTPGKVSHELLGPLHSNNDIRKEQANNTQNLDDPARDSPTSQKMVATFCVDEIVGSIVSWQPCSGISSSSADIRYGIVDSIDTESELALVQLMPALSDIPSGNFSNVIHRDTSSLLVQASNVGSTIWIPLRHIRFVAGKPAIEDISEFRRQLERNLSQEIESFESKCRADAKRREELSVELKDQPF
ncbi:hypothetical protein ACHAWF_008748 [Thalassiosira exigua]